MSNSFKIFILSTLLLMGFSCKKQTESIKVNDLQSDSALVVQNDSAALADAKKKEAELEKARLPKPYNEEENAEDKIAGLVKQAKKENKNIILQAGGNWCIWCLRFNNFVQTTPELKETVDKNYLYYHLNYSPNNKNEKVFTKYGNPGEKFGYPVFIILDKNGKLIHTQDSAVLEEGSGYSTEKVKEFLVKWAPEN